MDRKRGDGFDDTVSRMALGSSLKRPNFKVAKTSTSISKIDKLKFVPKEPVRGAIGPSRDYIKKNFKTPSSRKILTSSSKPRQDASPSVEAKEDPPLLPCGTLHKFLKCKYTI